MARRILPWLLVTLAVSWGLASCEAPGPGGLNLSFSWPEGADTTGELWVLGRVETRTGPIADDGSCSREDFKAVSLDGPVALESGETHDRPLSLGQLQYGPLYALVLEVREDDTTVSPAIYVGESHCFTLKPGVVTDISVDLELRTTIANPNHTAGKVDLQICQGGLCGADLAVTPVALVDLRLTASDAVSVELANDLTLSLGASGSLSFDGDGLEVGSEPGTYYYRDWDLNDVGAANLSPPEGERTV
ncbi:MAG: hypothetical protein VX938_12495, partial [Myxococcota bacterium]|nr:hypothetical protein [Myxococcota bacterium]